MTPAGGGRPGLAGELLYAQCWEDVDVAREALRIRAGDSVVAIGAAGDNVLGLLQDDPARILAIDVNPAQTAILQLKLAAIRCLDDPASVRRFLGAAAGDSRVATYDAIGPGMAGAARDFWNARQAVVAGGVLHAGRFERYVALFRRTVLPLVPGRATVRAMLRATSLDAQRRIYYEAWDSARWRLLFRVFFSRTLLQRFGRDRSFFDHAETTDVGAHYLARARHALTEVPIWTNPYLTYLLSGRYGQDRRLPDYLRDGVQAMIRQRAGRIAVETAELHDVLTTLPAASVDAFYLSDVFELSSPTAYEATMAEVARVGRPGARICYWNNLVPRRRPDTLANRLESHANLAARLHARDRAFLYSSLVVESVRGGRR